MDSTPFTQQNHELLVFASGGVHLNWGALRWGNKISKVILRSGTNSVSEVSHIPVCGMELTRRAFVAVDKSP